MTTFCSAFDETQSRQLPHLLAVQAGLKAEVKLVQRLGPGKARLAQS